MHVEDYVAWTVDIFTDVCIIKRCEGLKKSNAITGPYKFIKILKEPLIINCNYSSIKCTGTNGNRLERDKKVYKFYIRTKVKLEPSKKRNKLI